MASRDFDTAELHHCIDRIQAGDKAARDRLLRHIDERLRRLAGKMLRQFPGVRRWADTDDVTQGAALRLMRALQDARPESIDRFFGLAAELMRRELIDLARKFYGPMGIGSNHDSVSGDSDDPPAGGAPAEPHAAHEATHDLDKWHAFHDAVERLPIQQREVLGLSFYHGWTREQIADLFGVDVRTVRRRYIAALTQLREWLKDDFPEQK